MTPDQISTLRKLLAAATPRPWETGLENLYAPKSGIAGDNPVHTLGRIARDEDRDLIAAAVNALPALLDAAEEANATRALLKDLTAATGATAAWSCDCGWLHLNPHGGMACRCGARFPATRALSVSTTTHQRATEPVPNTPEIP